MKPVEFIGKVIKADQPQLKGLKVRLGLILLFAVPAAIIPPFLGFQFLVLPLFILCSIALAGNLIALAWIVRGKGLGLRIYFSTFIDFILITIGIHYLGGIESPFVWIYAVVIVATATLHGVRIGIFGAVLSFLMCSLLLIGEFSGVISHIGYDRLNPVYLHQDMSYLLVILLSNCILFLSAAAISGLLSERLVQNKKKLEDAVEDRTRDLSTANEQLRQEINERTIAEEELRASKKRYETTLDAIPDIVYEATIDGKIVYANKSASKVLGYPREDLTKMAILDFLGKDGLEKSSHINQALLNGETPGPELYSIRRADGRTIPVESHVTILRRDGESPTFIGVNRDITDRKLSEQALAESLSLVRATLESTADGILVVDKNGNIQSYNKVFLEMWNMPRQMMESQDNVEVRMHMLSQAKYPEKAIQETEELYDNPDRENFHFLELKDGRIFERYSKPQIIEGKAAGIVISFRDVTERGRAEELLRKSEGKYRTLFEESRDVVYVSTPEGKLLDINPAGVELLGYSSLEEVLEIDVGGTYAHLADRDKFQKMMTQDGFVKDFELGLTRKDGQQLDVLVTANAVHNGRGELVAYRGIMRDITQQKRLQQQLIQAQKMESIGILAGGIAHDFNNILGGILGFASLAKTKIEEYHPIASYLDTIETSATRAANLTSQLLAFARGGKYQVRPTNLNDIINETVKIIGRTFDKSIGIEVNLCSQLPTVEADAGQIQQVLLNLCVNAKDAMDGGGKLIIETKAELLTETYTKTHVDARPGSYVILSVSDSGVGIDKETMQRIFEPFFTTKKEGKGTGLGLSMVYGVVKNHGGFVNVYSEMCVGTTFKVYLPASEKQQVDVPFKVEIPSRGDEWILVVDDEEPLRFLTQEILESRGYRVLLAENGAIAIDVYRKRQQDISLVILDMVMPIMGGREAFLEMKALDPKVKAILSTGYSQDGKAQKILDSGVSGFIQKPYQPDALLSKVRSVLDAGKLDLNSC